MRSTTTDNTTPDPRHLLAVKGLCRRVGGRMLWRDLSFDLRAGETLVVHGPSGSGKTLLLRAISLLDPLDAGSVSFRGRDATLWKAPAWRTRVLYLHQRPSLWDGTVQQNLARVFGMRERRGRAYDPDVAEALLTRLGRSAEMFSQPVERLSGGEAQIVALTRALLVDPCVLLLDEPTASLDADASLRVESFLTEWKAAAPERAIVWVSHSSAQHNRVADRRLDLAGFDDTEEAP